jgi:hypothetical protein
MPNERTNQRTKNKGGPLGLRELLMAFGWSTSSSIKAASAVMCDGSGGAYSHVAIGVGSNECDAHNNARYHITSCNTYYTVKCSIIKIEHFPCLETSVSCLCVQHMKKKYL